MLRKSIRSWMMYPKAYPMGFANSEYPDAAWSVASFSIPLTPPSEQSEVVPKSGACSKKDFTNGCNVVRISVFAADDKKLA